MAIGPGASQASKPPQRRSRTQAERLADQARRRRKAARRFLHAQGRPEAEVYRVYDEGPNIFWVLYLYAEEPRTAIVAGGIAENWRVISDFKGWGDPT